jgi:hypothetical protein
MTFEERISPPLNRLAHKLIDARCYRALESIANFLNATKGGEWRRLPAEEKLFWLERFSGLIGARGLGDSEPWMSDSDISQVSEILYHEIRALRKA